MAKAEDLEGAKQTETVDGVMDDTEAGDEDATQDTTPPEPGSDAGWADEEEEEKWSVLLDRTKCQLHTLCVDESRWTTIQLPTPLPALLSC